MITTESLIADLNYMANQCERASLIPEELADKIHAYATDESKNMTCKKPGRE